MLFKVPTEPAVHPRRSPTSTLHVRRAQARLAADWIRGRMIDPPTTAAARRFQTTSHLIGIELEALPPIDSVWANTPATVRDRFVRENLNVLWELIDRATATESQT